MLTTLTGTVVVVTFLTGVVLLYTGSGLTLGVEIGGAMILEAIFGGNTPRHTSSWNLMYWMWSAAEHFVQILEEMEDFLSSVHIQGKLAGLHLEWARDSKTMVCWWGISMRQ